MTTVFMGDGGNRSGRNLSKERQMRAELDAGNRVVILRRGVYFDVLLAGESVTYEALTEKPEGIG